VATAPSRRTRLPARERRAQILAAASELFRAAHYDDVSLDDVAERAGVTRGLINHHFGTKRELYLEVLRRFIDVDLIPVPEYVQGATLRRRLEESVDGWVAVIDESRDMALDFLRMSAVGDPEIRELMEQTRERTAHRICAVIGLGPVDALTPGRMAQLRILEAIAEAAVVQWLEYERLSKEQVRALVLEAFETAAERMIGSNSEQA
jgi:AcrR family transcriptional regulator